MSDDRQECLKILNEAIAFEEEGYNFFLERAKVSPSAMERSVFQSLADDEAGHKAYLVALRDKLTAGEDLAVMQPDTDEVHRTAQEIFTAAVDGAVKENAMAESELAILKGALEVEKRGYAMYKRGADTVQSAQAKAMFADLAAQEQEHYRLLNNTLDYLSDPEGFSTFDSGAMLDGG